MGNPNTGIVPPWRRGNEHMPPHGGPLGLPGEHDQPHGGPLGMPGEHDQPHGGPLGLPTRGNTGIIPPWLRGSGMFARLHAAGKARGVLRLPLLGTTPLRFTGLSDFLGDDASLPDTSFTALPTDASGGSSMSFVMPNPEPVYIPPASSGGSSASDFLGNLLGKVVGGVASYETARLGQTLLTKQYSPQNSAAMIGAYRNQAGVTAAQAEAQRAEAELEYERSVGARSGSVISSGIVIAGLAAVAAFMLFRRSPSSSKA